LQSREKATVSFVMSVCLSIRMEQLDQILYLCFFRRSVGKIQVLLKSNKNNRFTFMTILIDFEVMYSEIYDPLSAARV
jgi:hypothetical protein